jgi:transcriptional regulator with XRE-family HTH domain
MQHVSTSPATVPIVPRPVDKALGEVLRGLREQRNESREVLAVRAGIAVGTLARIELGTTGPTWANVRAIAEALEVSLSQLGKLVEAEERG